MPTRFNSTPTRKPVASYYWLWVSADEGRDTAAAHRSFSGRQTSLAKQAGPTGSPVPRSGTAGRFVWEPDHEPTTPVHTADEALGGLTEDSLLRARCLLDSPALPYWYRGGPVDARHRLQEAHSREAVELARRLGDPATLGWALTARFLSFVGT